MNLSDSPRRPACSSRASGWSSLRCAKLAEARTKLEARAKERFEQEMAEHRAKLSAREKAAANGKKPGGRPSAPPVEGPQPKDQINLTDEDSRIMPVAGGGFDQCHNAQAAVATESLLVIAVEVACRSSLICRSR
jgi:hypothetical protein